VLVGSGNDDFYTGFSEPGKFGSGGVIDANSNSGSSVGIAAVILVLASRYVETGLICDDQNQSF
jgi:hypothetical protein